MSEISAPSRMRLPALLANRDFWRLWYAGLIVFVVRWLETLAMAVFTYQVTHAPFLVAMMTMLRLLPMGLFGAILGTLAERIERRTAQVGVIALMGSTSGMLALLAYTGHLVVWHLAVASFINGVGWATDNPVRRVMIGEVVGSQHMGMAMSIDVGTNNASRMVGPTLGGILFATVGLHGAFALSVLLYATSLLAVLGLNYRNAQAPHDGGSVLARMREGLTLVRQDRRLVGTLVITIVYNVFGWPFTAMVPVIAQDRLHLTPEWIGILASMDGVGAFIGATVIALCVGPRFYARTYLCGVISYLVLLTVFALAADPITAGVALVLTGVGGAGFSIMQATLVYLAAPPAMRSRVLGVLSVCIGIGPVGFIHLGLMANAIGAPSATMTTGIEGLLALALTWRWWRVILA
ncbi:MAG TPA: MFS transporter [Acetobacteraceae bacterium]|nr:MFS transporter [Acetobacteraceae bacterium]